MNTTLTPEHLSAIYSLTIPEGATALSIACSVSAAPVDPSAVARLIHFRLRGGNKPRDTEITELKLRGHELVLELDGAPRRHTPVATANVPAAGLSVITFGIDLTSGTVSCNASGAQLSGTAHLVPKPGQTVELIFGFPGPGEMITGPVGWSFNWTGTVSVGGAGLPATWESAEPGTITPPVQAAPPTPATPAAPGVLPPDHVAVPVAAMDRLQQLLALALELQQLGILK